MFCHSAGAKEVGNVVTGAKRPGHRGPIKKNEEELEKPMQAGLRAGSAVPVAGHGAGVCADWQRGPHHALSGAGHHGSL